jgi:NADH-quinone oxidoreductase subunit G
MPRLTIDGREVSVPDGATVIQAAEQLGIFVPRYCYHPGLSIAGNCRICLVEVEKIAKLQIACNTPVSEGMVVHTKSDKAEEGRRAVLEFLLANHPLDCPVCDQSGECDLQNFYMNFGLYDPRFQEVKVKKKKAVPLGPHVMLDQERCILCSRCVRFTDEITKTGEFGIFNRGDQAELGLYPGETLDNAYSANVVDICPVGALTERDFRFKARVWYLKSAPSVCNGCSQGCNIDVHYLLDRPHLNDGARVVRIKPRYNPHVNQWWMCDEGRYGLEWVDHHRLTKVSGPNKRATDPQTHRPTDPKSLWDEALTIIALKLAEVPAARVGVIASAQLTNEELFLIREIFGPCQITAAVPQPPGSSDDFLIKADKNPNTAGATLLGLTGNKAPDAVQVINTALSGGLDLLWVFEHDLGDWLGLEKLRQLAETVPTFIYSGTNENATASAAHWVLPSAAYLENEGTFINCHGHLQRFSRVFPPLGDAREDWRTLLGLSNRLGRTLEWHSPPEIFEALARSVAPLAGLRYETIGPHGVALNP